MGPKPSKMPEDCVWVGYQNFVWEACVSWDQGQESAVRDAQI